jgi:hypothetical protein
MTASPPDDNRRAWRYDNETPEQLAARLRVVAERRAREVEHQRQKRAARKADQARAGHGESEEQSA